MSAEWLRTWFGWMTLINLGLFIFTALLSVGCRGFIYRVHGRMFGLTEEITNKALYYFLAFYKIGWIVLNLVPWCALVIMTK